MSFNPSNLLHAFALGALAAGAALAQSTSRVSVGPLNAEVPGGATWQSPAISGDGRYVAFIGSDPGLVPSASYTYPQVFVFDRLTCTNALVSVDASGVPANSYCSLAVLSFTGRYVAFVSQATNFSGLDTNGLSDIFVHDRDADGNGCFDETFAGATSTTLVSLNFLGTASGNNLSGWNGPAGQIPPTATAFWAISISASGNLVAFTSFATDLVPGDTNSALDVFVRDIALATTARVNLSGAGAQAIGGNSGGGVAISPDGLWVAFGSDATNLVPGDTNGITDVFLHGPGPFVPPPPLPVPTALVTAALGGGIGVGGTVATGVTSFALSTTGALVTFMSDQTNLVPGGSTGLQCFVRSTGAGATTTLVSTGPLGALGNSASFLPAISGNGTAVTFTSAATNLNFNPSGDTNGLQDIYFRDLVGLTTTRISVDSINNQATGGPFGCIGSSTSATPFYTAYASDQSNLILRDTNGTADVFLDDRSACVPGNVNSGAGPTAAVLSVNGSTGPVVHVAPNTPFILSLTGAPAGSGQGRYVVWAWSTLPERQLPLTLAGVALGCTVDAVPPPPQTGCTLPSPNPCAPQPIRCLISSLFTPGQINALAGTVPIAPSPAAAPWSVSSPGYPAPRTFTFQGLLEDGGAANSTGFSITNAVIVQIP